MILERKSFDFPVRCFTLDESTYVLLLFINLELCTFSNSVSQKLMTEKSEEFIYSY